MAVLVVRAWPGAAQAEDTCGAPARPAAPWVVVKVAALQYQGQAAKKIFLSNGGATPDELFTGGPDPTYSQFNDAMKSWGRYELLPAAAEADLVFEISFRDPISFTEKLPVYSPELKLVILDPKTHVVLWTFIESVRTALLQGHRDENLDKAMTKLVEDVKERVDLGHSQGPARPFQNEGRSYVQDCQTRDVLPGLHHCAAGSATLTGRRAKGSSPGSRTSASPGRETSIYFQRRP